MNDRQTLLVLGLGMLGVTSLTVLACTTPDPPQTAPAPPTQKDVRAPIESAELLIRESSPPQYALRIVSGLPDGCTKFARIDIKRQDTVIDVTVWNTVPADSTVMCTQIYGTVENTAELGSDYQSGETYTVRANGEPKITFTAH